VDDHPTFDSPVVTRAELGQARPKTSKRRLYHGEGTVALDPERPLHRYSLRRMDVVEREDGARPRALSMQDPATPDIFHQQVGAAGCERACPHCARETGDGDDERDRAPPTAHRPMPFSLLNSSG
jgi:hypothetical protein